MSRVLRISIPVALLMLYITTAYAQGGACPSGANYLNPVNNSQVTLPSLGITKCFYIAANGSDSNDGTSEASPWLHAPGMPACTGGCASLTPGPGMGFIFRGGDAWHFGNSGLPTYTGEATNCDGAGTPCGFHIQWSGSSGSPIYYGIDLGWFSGSSWARPQLNGDNPLSGTGVSACRYDQSGKSLLMEPYNVAYTIVDDFEFLGMCWSGANNAVTTINLSTSINNTYRVISRVAIHGWTHVSFECSLSNGEPMGHCDGGSGITGPSDRTLGVGDTYAQLVCDGSDSDHTSFICVFAGGYDIHNSVFQNAANAVVINNSHTMHDNLFQNLYYGSDGVGHGNAAEFNVMYKGVNAIYNNVYRNLWSNGCEVTMWETPYSTDYAFNNVIYGNPCGGSNYWNEVLAGSSGFTANLFNNTFYFSADNPVIAGAPAGSTVNFLNNQCITPSGGTPQQCSSYQGTEAYNGTINQSQSSAASQGYSSSQIFAYSPTSSTNATVGTGTNQQGLCSALTSSSDPLLQAAGNACQYDTTYACAYNASTFSVTCPARTPLPRPSKSAWDVGAYQFSTAGPTPPSAVAATLTTK